MIIRDPLSDSMELGSDEMTCQILSIGYRTARALHAAYMPFLQHGGVFVRDSLPARLGQSYFLLLSLPDQSEPLTTLAKVVWVTPASNRQRSPPGTGLQFSGASDELRVQIERFLQAQAHGLSDVPTHVY